MKSKNVKSDAFKSSCSNNALCEPRKLAIK